MVHIYIYIYIYSIQFGCRIATARNDLTNTRLCIIILLETILNDSIINDSKKEY